MRPISRAANNRCAAALAAFMRSSKRLCATTSPQRPERQRLAPAIGAAEGAWTDEDVDELEAKRAELWSTWQTGRFQTPMS
jgi:hypothetical protein